MRFGPHPPRGEGWPKAGGGGASFQGTASAERKGPLSPRLRRDALPPRERVDACPSHLDVGLERLFRAHIARGGRCRSICGGYRLEKREEVAGGEAAAHRPCAWRGRSARSGA